MFAVGLLHHWVGMCGRGRTLCTLLIAGAAVILARW